MDAIRAPRPVDPEYVAAVKLLEDLTVGEDRVAFEMLEPIMVELLERRLHREATVDGRRYRIHVEVL